MIDDPIPDALRWLTTDRPAPVLRVRCATRRHRVADVYLLSDRRLLWIGRLPQPATGEGHDPATWPGARAPLPEPDRVHWAQAAWWWSEVEPHAHDSVLWGCRCTGVPAAMIWEEISEFARDRSRRDVEVWP